MLGAASGGVRRVWSCPACTAAATLLTALAALTVERSGLKPSDRQTKLLRVYMLIAAAARVRAAPAHVRLPGRARAAPAPRPRPARPRAWRRTWPARRRCSSPTRRSPPFIDALEVGRRLVPTRPDAAAPFITRIVCANPNPSGGLSVSGRLWVTDGGSWRCRGCRGSCISRSRRWRRRWRCCVYGGDDDDSEGGSTACKGVGERGKVRAEGMGSRGGGLLSLCVSPMTPPTMAPIGGVSELP